MASLICFKDLEEGLHMLEWGSGHERQSSNPMRFKKIFHFSISSGQRKRGQEFRDLGAEPKNFFFFLAMRPLSQLRVHLYFHFRFFVFFDIYKI